MKPKTIKQHFKIIRDAENKVRPNAMPQKLDSMLNGLPAYNRILFQLILSKLEEFDNRLKSLENIINNQS